MKPTQAVPIKFVVVLLLNLDYYEILFLYFILFPKPQKKSVTGGSGKQ